MRKIYKSSWGGPHRHDKMSLLATTNSGDSAEEDPAGPSSMDRHGRHGLDSSFDRNHHPNHTKPTGIDGPAGAAAAADASTAGAASIQFVPADQEPAVPAIPSNDTGSHSVYDETSWDAIANDTNAKMMTRGPSSAIVTPSLSAHSHTKGSRKCFQSSHKFHQQDETRSVSAVPSSNHAKTHRISRLASLFSSRAIVQSDSNDSQNAATPTTTQSNETPASPTPPGSESSTGYVGWPGTQDRRGGTVVVESSYEESDTGMNNHSVRGTVQDRHPVVVLPGSVDREGTAWTVPDAAATAAIAVAVSTGRRPSNNNHDRIRNDHGNKTPPRPVVGARAEREKIHRLASPSPLVGRVPSLHDVYGRDEDVAEIGRGPGGFHDESESDVSTSYSKTSSAYFNTRDVQAIRTGQQLSGVHQSRQAAAAAAAVMRRYQQQQQQQQQHNHHHPDVPNASSSSSPGRRQVGLLLPQASSLTEETLAMKDQMDPPHRVYNAMNAVGFRGLLDKTQDVPNLMDDVESDSTSAASAATSRHSSVISGQYNPYGTQKASRYHSTSQRSRQPRQNVIMEEGNNTSRSFEREDADSDVFDGISARGGSTRQGGRTVEEDAPGILGAASRASMDMINLALLGGGLTTIQTTADDFTNRKTASDFDENLTNSDCDQYGYARIPAFHEMAAAGRSKHDRSLSSQSLLFSTPSERAKRVLEKHRQRNNNHHSNNTSGSESGSSLYSDHYPAEAWGQNVTGDLNRYYVHPEEMKILVKKFRKMSRERYPHLDYEDLEKEEDATKAFALSEMRSRIMEKDIERGLERRGGTTVVDDIVMTPFNRAALRVRDAVIVAKAWRDGATPQDVINTSLLTRRAERTFYIPRLLASSGRASKYSWEEVTWVDDLELSQYRCHSIGPRHLKGVEMFTIGDCQSMLLKLCHDRCQDLRAELNQATARHIDAEEAMKEDGDNSDGMMTESEMTYLTSMEEVKTISHKLVLAEKAFTLVKDRIEKLVAKYEALLVRFENETDSVAPSSVFTCESSCYSDDYSFNAAEERERDALARRAQRAELRAELAAREALLARQHAKKVREEKEQELHALKMKLADLQSESSAAITEREHSVVLARAITANSRNGAMQQTRVANSGGGSISRSKIDDVKQRFRDRNAAKINKSGGTTRQSSSGEANNPKNNTNSFYRTVGEEMFQHLDFYERSLKAVETPR